MVSSFKEILKVKLQKAQNKYICFYLNFARIGILMKFLSPHSEDTVQDHRFYETHLCGK